MVNIARRERRGKLYCKMKLSGQFQACLIFYKKPLSVKKAKKKKKGSKRKTNNFSPLGSFSAQKIVAFVVFCSLNFILLVGFGMIYVFVHLKFLRKKK